MRRYLNTELEQLYQKGKGMKNWDKHFTSYEEFVAACDAEPLGYWDTKGNYHLSGDKKLLVNEKLLYADRSLCPVDLYRTVHFSNERIKRTVFEVHFEGDTLVGHIIKGDWVFSVAYNMRRWVVTDTGTCIGEDSRKGWY